MSSSDHNATLEFDPTKRLDDLPPLGPRYRLDEILTEHFAFAPKTFTHHLFNLINEAVFDCVDAVEDAIRVSFPADLAYPSQDDVSKSVNSLETFLCSQIDRHFDLLEIWLHRNIFAFISKKPEALMEHFKFEHSKLWDYLFQEEKPLSEKTPYVTPDWEKIKLEEENTWDELEKGKQEFLKVSDDHESLLAVSRALDRKLAGLKAVSTQLDLMASEAPRVYDPESKKPLGLSSQAAKLVAHYSRLHQLQKRLDERNDSADSVNQNSSEGPSEGVPRHPSAPFRYESLLNELAMSKIDDLAAELGEKAGPDNQVDECLIEVMNHLAAKGEATDADTRL